MLWYLQLSGIHLDRAKVDDAQKVVDIITGCLATRNFTDQDHATKSEHFKKLMADNYDFL